MIDIHSHVLFDVDDGCFHIETSIETIKEEAQGGVTDIICTPHVDSEDVDIEKHRNHFNQLKERLKEENINVNIHTGAEIGPNFNPSILWNRGINLSVDGLNKYALIGPFFTDKYYETSFQTVLYDLQMLKIIPIIAHPERMSYFQDNPELLTNFLNQGCLLQVNAQSLLGLYDEKCETFSNRLLELNYISFVASDKHRKYGFSLMEKAYNHIKENYGEALANKLCYENPKKILDSVPMVNYDYKTWTEPPKPKKSFWSFLKK
ncbi:MAG: hypothetical protein IJS60_01055 [Abditibacteriota bacterium]|nr:hypothetical protein [Abditibacteriota bacterium]